MKTSVCKLLKSRLVQAGGLLAVIALAASIAWSDPSENRAKLGGTWVGKLGDISWTSTYSPDPSGQNATVTLQWITLSTDFEALFGAVGADSTSLVSGTLAMVNNRTATGKFIWYIYSTGKASATAPVAGQIKALAVMSNEWHFTSPTTAVGKHVLRIYFLDPQAPMVPNENYRFFEQAYENVNHVKIF